MMKRATGRIGGAVLLGLGLGLLAFSGGVRPALAGGGHTHTHIGIGVVAPLYPYGDPYYRHYQRPPNVYYAPAPQPAAPAMDKSYCREYQSSANIAGKTQKTYGTACRQPDGSWRIIN